MTDPHVFGVILAGGSGTRFWPASRVRRPKQLLAIGPTPQPLIAATVRRIEAICPADRTLIATGEHLVSGTKEALPWLPPSSFLGEPRAKNTAPCIAWAASIAHRRDPEAVCMVLPSDQHIADEDAFRAAVELALESARAGAIATIGITPTRPETGYGYIEAGDTLKTGARRVVRFVEKPDRVRAEEYVSSGRYLWNAGMFFFRAKDMLRALRDHEPTIHKGIVAIEAAAEEGGAAAEAEATRAAFESFPSISIDYAVMERVKNLEVVPGDFGWSDLGSWESAWDLGKKDADRNVAPEHAVLVDAKNNLVADLRTQASARTIALVGVDDLCVIETDDALLVIPRDKSQDVRAVVDALKARGRADLL